jgi:hypothetical protein
MRRAALLCALVACGGADDPPVIDVSELTYRTCAADAHVGGFAIVLADQFTAVQGKVMDGVVPGNLLAVIESGGECRRLAAPILACEPACGPSETCDVDGACIAHPLAISVGTVEVLGLAAALTMEPTAPTNTYSNPGSLPHPGFAAGAGIALDAGGGSLAPFRLLGWGVSPLAGAPAEIEVQPDAALALAWTAPVEAGPARVRLTLNVNGHGLVGQRLECEVDDDGAFTIPAALIGALIDDGVSGFPTLELSRASSDRVDLAPGCVDLRVESSRVIDVTIPGLISCNGDDDCPDGQTCRGDLTCG